MDPPQPLEFKLEVSTGLKTVRDVVTGILHTIFFHRWFPEIEPEFRDILDVTLPHVPDAALEAEIDESAKALERQLRAERDGGGGGPHTVVVQFTEKRRKRGWLGPSEDEVCWEVWNVTVTVAEPRTESDRIKARRSPGSSLERAAFDIVTKVNAHTDHIPPITTSGDGNPFPYAILVPGASDYHHHRDHQNHPGYHSSNSNNNNSSHNRNSSTNSNNGNNINSINSINTNDAHNAPARDAGAGAGAGAGWAARAARMGMALPGYR